MGYGAAIVSASQQGPGDDRMKHQSIMVVIPPEMADHDECYTEVVEYVAACTGFNCIRGDQHCGDSVLCDTYFRDNKGNTWRGRLCEPPYPDGSRKYIVDLEKESAEP